MSGLPEWLGAPLWGALIAAVGYVAKLGADVFSARREAQKQRDARLIHLHGLLRAGRAVYEAQSKLRDRLCAQIKARQPELVNESNYDRILAKGYATADADERELHSVIRGMTMHAQRRINRALAAWLDSDVDYRRGYTSDAKWREFGALLRDLEAHLLMWHAKYRHWIPNHEERSIVYLNDEEKHGVGFPTALDGVVAQLIADRFPKPQEPKASKVAA